MKHNNNHRYEFHALLHIEICILDMEDDDKIELYMNEVICIAVELLNLCD